MNNLRTWWMTDLTTVRTDFPTTHPILSDWLVPIPLNMFSARGLVRLRRWRRENQTMVHLGLNRRQLSIEHGGAHSCPPRGWSGAWVGVGILRVAGDSLAWKYKMVVWFVVSWLLVSWCSKSYQISISCFQEDIGAISNICSFLLNGCRLSFPKSTNFPSFIFLKITNMICLQCSMDCFWFCLGVLVAPKINIIGLSSRGHYRHSLFFVWVPP